MIGSDNGMLPVQCRVIHYQNEYWLTDNWALRDKLIWNLNENTIIFIQQNKFQNDICKMLKFQYVIQIGYISTKIDTT